MGERKCGNCDHFTKKPMEQSGECRRYPPTVLMVPGKVNIAGQVGFQMMGSFPTVKPEWRCGEYVERTIPKPGKEETDG